MLEEEEKEKEEEEEEDQGVWHEEFLYLVFINQCTLLRSLVGWVAHTTPELPVLRQPAVSLGRRERAQPLWHWLARQLRVAENHPLLFHTQHVRAAAGCLRRATVLRPGAVAVAIA